MRNRRSKKLLLGMVLMVVGLSLTIINIKNDPSNMLAIGLVLAIIGLILAVREMYKQESLELISKINDCLTELGYTDEQIKDRQVSLYQSDIDELKELKSKVDVKIKQKREDDFFNTRESS
ncbi:MULTISPECIES: hypothetical protein [Mammaliicoccus]|uniref:hypothetical protein n=1 Tax=Mammaliicoccus TaxID=2803850 RepID=UPI001EFAF6A9|nr:MULTISPECIES: hypothetical protein [Mammaliicoccus]